MSHAELDRQMRAEGLALSLDDDKWRDDISDFSQEDDVDDDITIRSADVATPRPEPKKQYID
jgi:hypothetical protein